MRYITSIKINVLAILGIVLILASAYAVEFYYNEPPCPLCMLQRFGFLATSFGFLLNLRFGNKMQHYGISLIAALFTAAIAARQILLHIFTHSGVYGPSFFGLHLYTWSFLIAVLMILFIALALTLEPPQHGIGERPEWMKWIAAGAFASIIIFSLANALTAFVICGFKECPENPLPYGFLKHEAAENDAVKPFYYCS